MAKQRLLRVIVPAIDGGFALAVFLCGYFQAPTWLAGLAAFGMLAYWSWSRRAVLDRLRGAAWASLTGLGVAVLIAILGGAYWLGLGVGGAF